MAESEFSDRLTVLKDPLAMQVFSIVAQNFSRSTTQLAAETGKPYDDVEHVLNDLTDVGLVQKKASDLPGSAFYLITKEGAMVARSLPKRPLVWVGGAIKGGKR